MIRTPGRMLRAWRRHAPAFAGAGIEEAGKLVRSVRAAFVATNWGYNARRGVGAGRVPT